MSTLDPDDIVFGEMSYREPQRALRPDRDRAYACLAYEVPQAGDLLIFIDKQPADAIERHALSDTSVELGGILLGRECLDQETGEPFVRITVSLEAKHYENTQASFTYTHDSWAEINRERDEKYPDHDIVGWYHTHPDFGCFLSGHDLFIQHHFFGQPLQVALVVDPVRQTRLFFQWRDGQMEAVGGYYVTADRTDRAALARFIDDLENVPNNPGTGGGMLSPRLEAELIDMLNRPHQTVVAAPASPQTSLTFGLVGLLVGMMLVAGAMWLNNLGRTVQDLADSQEKVQKALDKRLGETDSARISVKEQMLDALLQNVRLGATKDSFLGSYQKALEERNEARQQVEALTTEKAAVTELSTRLRAERKGLDDQIASLEKKIDKFEAARDAQKAELAELDKQLKAEHELVAETRAGLLQWKYQIAWYTAAAALGLCSLFGLGLIYFIAQVPPPLLDLPTPMGPRPNDTGPRPNESPPHHIT